MVQITSCILALSLLFSYTQAANDTLSSCPQVWSSIASDLKRNFAGCNNLARSAVRFAFHDSAGYSVKNPTYSPASGGADGSLLLSDEEVSRSDQNPLQGFRSFLLGKYNGYKDQDVSAADFVQVAGMIGVKACPGGPVVKTVVGREDNSDAAPDGLLPQAFGQGADYQTLIDLWADKGFSPRELAALIGAHSTSRAFAQQQNGIPTGGQQDSSPRVWDVKYYSQTQSQSPPRGVYRFQSDVNLANPETETGKAFSDFARNPGAWAAEFSAAFYKLSIAGIPEDVVAGLIDCTAVVQ
ncbi:class II peroxidase [Hortaea werneckii]|nr:class II peroxidase [Hortaea werneckii]